MSYRSIQAFNKKRTLKESIILYPGVGLANGAGGPTTQQSLLHKRKSVTEHHQVVVQPPMISVASPPIMAMTPEEPITEEESPHRQWAEQKTIDFNSTLIEYESPGVNYRNGGSVQKQGSQKKYVPNGLYATARMNPASPSQGKQQPLPLTFLL